MRLQAPALLVQPAMNRRFCLCPRAWRRCESADVAKQLLKTITELA